jgi:phage shock protein A
MNLREYILSKLRELFAPAPPPDPQEQLRALLARLHGELREAKIQAADLIRQEKQLEREEEECLRNVERAEAAAMASIRNGNETAARRHLEQKLHANQVLRQLQEQLATFRTQVQGLRDAIEAYKLEIERVEYEQKTWEVRQRTARLKSSLGSEPTSTAISEARALLRASRDAALREEARVEVRETVRRRQPEIRAYQSAADRAVDQELERLRNQLNPSAPKK